MAKGGSEDCPFSEKDIRLLAAYTARRLGEFGIKVSELSASFRRETCFLTVKSETTSVDVSIATHKLMLMLDLLRRMAAAKWN